MNSPLDLSPSYEGVELTVADILDLPHIRGTKVLAGRGGLERIVASVNVMENPDIIPWVKADELLITVGYSLHGEGTNLERLIVDLDDRHLAAFGIKLGPYVTEVAQSVLDRADKLDFPLLSLNGSWSFDEMIGDVYSARNQRAVGDLHRSSELEQDLISVALSGSGPADVARRFAQRTDCEILATGAMSEVIAHFEGDADRDPAPRDPRDSRLFDEAISAPIVAGSAYVGQLHAFPNMGTSAARLRPLVSTCARIMALVASRELAVAAVDRQFHSELMGSIVNNRIEHSEIERRCQGLEWELQLPCNVISIRHVGANASDVERVEAGFKRWLRYRNSRPPVAIMDGAVVGIVPIGLGDDRSVAAELASQVLPGQLASDWSLGISGQVDDLGGLNRGWRQAQMTARVGTVVSGPGRATHFTDVGAYRLLVELDASVLREFAQVALGEVLDADGHRADLRGTLAVLLETQLNLAETARRLHFHYNTIRYRLTQLEKILGPFRDEPRRCLELHLALLICDMQDLDTIARRRVSGNSSV